MKPPMNRSESVEVGKQEWDIAVVNSEPDGANHLISHKTAGDVTVVQSVSEESYRTLNINSSDNNMLSGIDLTRNTKNTENHSDNCSALSTGSFPTLSDVEQYGDINIVKSKDTRLSQTSSLYRVPIDEVNDSRNRSNSSPHPGTQGEEITRTSEDKKKYTSFTKRDEKSHEMVSKTASHTHTSLSHKPIKPGRQIFRWNLLFNLLVWSVVSLPIWVPFVSNCLSVFILPGIQSVFVFMWVVICCLASRNMFKIYRFKKKSVDLDTESPVHHLFVISCYKEPVDLIARSVQTIANQKDVRNISMTISFEEKTPDLARKTRKLRKIFSTTGFARLLFAVHPFGQANEIPGKCSNANNGFRESVNVLQREMGANFDAENILVTTCDADSQFPTNYTAALCQKFRECNHKHSTIFQAPLFYNWGLDGASFVTRVTGLIRSTLMMGALIPFNINSMSIFSFSLRLCVDGNYVHPAYQMDDIICLIRWMGVTRRRIHICALPVPVLSGPTSGSTVEIDVIEWARQARRWTIGAAEVFHYFAVKFPHMPKLPALTWGLSFLIYYGILLCSGSLYSLLMSLSMIFLVDTSAIPDYVQYWMYGLAACQQLCFLVVFIIDVFATRALGVKECICLARNILHWILTPFVLLAYSLVEFYALHEVAIRGKKVCKHGASNKDALKA